ncbi:MAG: GNAT family N-acetyltransferase [Acidimicrobiia bacterium]
MSTRVSHTSGIVTITDVNTTIGYCRYDPSGEIEYLFVSPAFRRRGYATKMLDIVRARLGIMLHFAPPISPLGRQFLISYAREQNAMRDGEDGQATPLS